MKATQEQNDVTTWQREEGRKTRRTERYQQDNKTHQQDNKTTRQQ